MRKHPVLFLVGVAIVVIAVGGFAYQTYSNFSDARRLAAHQTMVAIWNGHLADVKPIIARAPTVDWLNDDTDESNRIPYQIRVTCFGQTFLTCAVSRIPAELDLVQFLVASGADVNKKNMYGLSPLKLIHDRMANGQTGPRLIQPLQGKSTTLEDIAQTLAAAGAKE
jgi:hypothetical protein